MDQLHELRRYMSYMGGLRDTWCVICNWQFAYLLWAQRVPIDGGTVRIFEGKNGEMAEGKWVGQELTGQKSVRLFDISRWGQRSSRRRAGFG